MIIVGQGDQCLGGDVHLAAFIVAVGLLGAVEVRGQILLKQVTILAKITDAGIMRHGGTSFCEMLLSCHTGELGIDIYRKTRYDELRKEGGANEVSALRELTYQDEASG